jgi:hypothetical protein
MRIVETLYSAYNEGSKRYLSPRLSVVDAERYPLKVLKILMEGLAPSARGGIWLVNFKGIPVARSHSAFDLVYLDSEHRVVQAIEISQSSEFTPFKGDPSSALILPATTLIRSKTFSGDRLTLSEVGHSTTEATKPDPEPKRAALPKATRIVPAMGGKAFNVPAPAQATDLRAPAPAVSGRLMRSGSLALKQSPKAVPSIAPVVAQEVQPSAETKVVPISIANERAEVVAQTLPGIAPELDEIKTPVTALATTSKASAARQQFTGDDVAGEAIAEAVESDLLDKGEVSPSEISPRPRPAKTPAKYAMKQEPAKRKSWDIQLLYMLFPELDPSYRPEFRAPVVNFTADVLKRHEEKLSKKIQILSWFYPNLELETVKQRQREHRRAPRIPVPGLVGFYFSGGHSQPHEIRNLSVMGFYMITDERWLPGTVIRITLQIIDSPGDDPRDTLTVLSRVVNWGPDGGGFEFVMPGFVD